MSTSGHSLSPFFFSSTLFLIPAKHATISSWDVFVDPLVFKYWSPNCPFFTKWLHHHFTSSKPVKSGALVTNSPWDIFGKISPWYLVYTINFCRQDPHLSPCKSRIFWGRGVSLLPSKVRSGWSLLKSQRNFDEITWCIETVMIRVRIRFYLRESFFSRLWPIYNSFSTEKTWLIILL